MGDIESAPFVEAMRQFQFRVGYENFALIHVSLVPDMHGEQKTKPTQTTVHALRGLGLLPDLVRRSFCHMCTSYNVWLRRTDCLPVVGTPSAREIHKRQDFHVLSRIDQPGPGRARRVVRVSRSSFVTISRNYRLSTHKAKPCILEYF